MHLGHVCVKIDLERDRHADLSQKHVEKWQAVAFIIWVCIYIDDAAGTADGKSVFQASKM